MCRLISLFRLADAGPQRSSRLDNIKLYLLVVVGWLNSNMAHAPLLVLVRKKSRGCEPEKLVNHHLTGLTKTINSWRRRARCTLECSLGSFGEPHSLLARLRPRPRKGAFDINELLPITGRVPELCG